MYSLTFCTRVTQVRNVGHLKPSLEVPSVRLKNAAFRLFGGGGGKNIRLGLRPHFCSVSDPKVVLFISVYLDHVHLLILFISPFDSPPAPNV